MADVDSIRPYKKGTTPPLDWIGTRSWLDTELAKVAQTLKTIREVLTTIEGRVADVETLPALTYATLPGSPTAGTFAYITDSNTAVWGATAAGGGANAVAVWFNGTNWTVVGA
jgi:hypothetical protein